MKLGVCTHLNYSDGAYNLSDKVIECLRILGCDLVRTAAPKPTDQGQDNIIAVARAGVRFCFTAQGDTLPAQVVANIKAMLAQQPMQIEAIEGPNEVNNWPIKIYPGLSGEDAALRYQTELYNAVKAGPALKSIPVYSFTGGKSFGPCDARNEHPYPQYGVLDIVGYMKKLNGMGATDKPIVFTETGYQTNPFCNDNAFIGVSDDLQAEMTVALLKASEAAGVQAVYLYQLLDDYWLHRGNRSKVQQWGLFDLGYRPKAVVAALRGM